MSGAPDSAPQAAESLDSALQPNGLPSRVVHLVGRVTAEVLGFLAPTTLVLAQHGVRQHVLVLGLDADAHRASKWGLAPEAVIDVLAPDGNRLRRWHRLAQALNRELASDEHTTLHLHGYLPALLGSVAALVAQRRTPMLYSPHGSRSLRGPWPFAALLRALPRPPASAIASHAFESSRLSGQTRAPVHLAECPLPPGCLKVQRVEADRPCVLAGVLERPEQGAREVARMAVLLADDGLRAQMEWMGAADEAAAAMLRAVRVPVLRGEDAAADLARLGRAWVFLAPSPSNHFPVLLAQAMALGLPCVALDGPYHSELIEHGVTGFLCEGPADLLHWTTTLLQSSALRLKLGTAARAHARERFDEGRFRQALLQAYSGAVPGAATPLRADPSALPSWALMAPRASVPERALGSVEAPLP